MKIQRTQGLSLLIHAIIVLVFFSGELKTPDKKVELLQFEIKETPKKKILVKDLRSNEKKTAASGSLFLPSMNSQSLLALVEKNSGEAATNTKTTYQFNDQKTYDPSIEDVFGDNGNQNWEYNREIYRRIDTNLLFDSILAQYNHFGRVYVQFTVTENGLVNFSGLKTDATDAILKVHVLRAIKKSLLQPVESMKAMKKLKLIPETVFQAEFNFTYGDHNNNFAKQNNFGRPVFVFNRSTTEKPVPKELLEQLLTGGVTPNISLMYERWQKYNKKKHLESIQFDPFENYKRDSFYRM